MEIVKNLIRRLKPTPPGLNLMGSDALKVLMRRLKEAVAKGSGWFPGGVGFSLRNDDVMLPLKFKITAT